MAQKLKNNGHISIDSKDSDIIYLKTISVYITIKQKTIQIIINILNYDVEIFLSIDVNKWISKFGEKQQETTEILRKMGAHFQNSRTTGRYQPKCPKLHIKIATIES